MMFGTLRYDRESQHAEFIDRTDSFLGDAATEHAACDKCRLTKLRCTGQRSGCDRCKVRGTPCVYSATGSRESRKAKKVSSSGSSIDSKPKKQKKHHEKAHTSKRAGNSKSKATEKRNTGSSRLSVSEKTASIAEESDLNLMGQGEDETETIQPKQKRGQDQDVHLLGGGAEHEHGVLDVLTSWSHPNAHLDPLDLEMPTSQYDGLPDIGFLTNSLMDTSNFPDLDPEGTADDGHFPFFTSSESPFRTLAAESLDTSPSSTEPGSAITSPRFTTAPDSPITTALTDPDLDMMFGVEVKNTNTNNKPVKFCECLSGIAKMMDELDDLLQPLSSNSPFTKDAGPMANSTIDDMLASLKTQISNATRILQCTVCHSREEHISLGIRVCEMIVRWAEHIVLSYELQSSQQQSHGHPPTVITKGFQGIIPTAAPPTPSHLHADLLSAGASTTVNPANINIENDTVTQAPSTISSLSLGQDDFANNSGSGMNPTGIFFFGRYKTDPSEYEALMRVLIGLQLRALAGLLGGILGQGRIRPQMGVASDGGRIRLSVKQVGRIQAAQGVVGGLIVRLEGTPQGFLTCA